MLRGGVRRVSWGIEIPRYLYKIETSLEIAFFEIKICLKNNGQKIFEFLHFSNTLTTPL
jgi:hypothetical protein